MHKVHIKERAGPRNIEREYGNDLSEVESGLLHVSLRRQRLRYDCRLDTNPQPRHVVISRTLLNLPDERGLERLNMLYILLAADERMP